MNKNEKSVILQEMNLQEMENVNGGILPAVVWIVTAIIVGVGVTNVVTDK